jgi:hypothetical protein
MERFTTLTQSLGQFMEEVGDTSGYVSSNPEWFHTPIRVVGDFDDVECLTFPVDADKVFAWSATHVYFLISDNCDCYYFRRAPRFIAQMT